MFCLNIHMSVYYMLPLTETIRESVGYPKTRVTENCVSCQWMLGIDLGPLPE